MAIFPVTHALMVGAARGVPRSASIPPTTNELPLVGLDSGGSDFQVDGAQPFAGPATPAASRTFRP
jgi:hypothetical protein